MSTEKSKKNKSNLSSQKKADLWNVFETEVLNPDKKVVPLECLYRTVGDRENCERCQYTLAFSEEGFLTCTKIGRAHV